MTRVVRLAAVRKPPARRVVLRGQGIPERATVPERVETLLASAARLYEERTDPVGIWTEVSVAEFERIYAGEGLNARSTPLERIYPRAARLALFAATVGNAVCLEIRRLFEDHDPALGYALDSIASERADAASEELAHRYLEAVHGEGDVEGDRVLAYSPGYCGWHVSGQRKLFDALEPEEIGVTLNPSFLMQPLKSVSGVLVAGPAAIHDFDDEFDFCENCDTRQCRARIASLTDPRGRGQGQGGSGWQS